MDIGNLETKRFCEIKLLENFASIKCLKITECRILCRCKLCKMPEIKNSDELSRKM